MANNLLRQVGIFIISLGVDPRRMISSFRFLPRFAQDAWIFRRAAKSAATSSQFQMRWLPVLADRHLPSGTAKGHYFHQDLWAARRVFSANPSEHVDVGSRIDGFIAHLLTFRSVKVLDIRPMASRIEGLEFQVANLMGDHVANVSSDSVSCLHALEHFGLGRYGDPLDIDGWRRGLKNLCAMTSPGGHLYLGVPIGHEQRVEFNAQRIFAPCTIPEEAAMHGMVLEEFSYIDDAGDFHERVPLGPIKCNFGCGCYVLKKPNAGAIQ